MSLTGDNVIKLTERQLEILEYLAKGHTNSEISRILKLSGNTVKAHIRNIYEKLDVTNRTEAALCYKENETTNTMVDNKPILIVKLFSSSGETEVVEGIRNEQRYHLAVNLQTELMILLSNRKIFSVRKDTTSNREYTERSQGYLISGDIHIKPEGINVSIHIEKYPQGIHIWSKNFYEPCTEGNIDSKWLANKIVASSMYHLAAKEASSMLESKPQDKNVFQNTLLGFHLLNLATSESIIAAQQVFDKIILSDPSNITVLYGKCVTAYLMLITHLSKNTAQDYQIVENCCSQVSAISKNCAETWYMRGLLSLLKQDRKGAILLFQNAQRIDPSLQEIYLMLAQLYTIAGDCNNGQKYLEQAISLCPDYQYKGNNLVAISIIYFCLEQYEKAVMLLEESAYLQEENVLSILLYICSLYYAGDKEKAYDMSKKNITVDKTYLHRVLALADERIRTRFITALTAMKVFS